MGTPAIVKNGKIELLEPMDLPEGKKLNICLPELENHPLKTKQQVRAVILQHHLGE